MTLKLSQPDAALPGILSDRAGMMVSPTAIKTNGNIDRKPVGAGALCLRKLDRQREAGRQALRQVLARQRAISRRNRIRDHSGGRHRRALRRRRPERSRLCIARAPESRAGARFRHQADDWSDGLLPADLLVGQAAVRRHPHSQGAEFRAGSGDFRQGDARGRRRTRLHEPAVFALGL